jgi:23S rRNA (guanine2445-N2)-methyltransferase / 23S rRNA (guanine2069-N7)-methyltransferase
MPLDHVVLKVRRRQREGAQVEARREGGERFEIGEGGHRFVVNLTDRLDTGIYLDHRRIRAMIAELVPGKSFLNLFAYTCTATVYAAAANAARTTSVDLSRTYLSWGEENLARNRPASYANEIVRADCLEWLERERRTFDVILLNPPVYSRSKGMDADDFDVVRDHVPLVRSAAARLAPSGVMFFSTHAKKLVLDREGLAGLEVEDVSARTVPRDFARSPHLCFRITRANTRLT